MARFFAGIVTGIAGLLGGGWLMAAPFALGFQRDHARWADATKVDVFTGAGILALGFLTLVCFTVGLVAALRAEGALGTRGRRAASRRRPAAAANDPIELQALVTRVALALEERTGGAAGQQPAQERRAS